MYERSPLRKAKLPWIGHKASELFYKRITGEPSKEGGLPSNLYCGALRKKLSEPWLLSWHWRSLLPAIMEWNKDLETESFILQICQTRGGIQLS